MDNKLQNKKISLRLNSQLVKQIDATRGVNRSNKIKRILEAGLNNQALDNNDYSEIIEALFDLKKKIAPLGSNLNQLVLYLNSGNELNNIKNIDALDKLLIQFKQWIKLMKYIERELKLR